MVLMTMGKSMRNFKSSLTRSIRLICAKKWKTKEEYLDSLKELKPKEVSSHQWDKFVKERTSNEFKGVSEKFQELRSKKTFVHTTGWKSFACLEHEMEQEAGGKNVSRVDVWIRAHSRNGAPSNEAVAQAMAKLNECSESQNSKSTNTLEDSIAQVLGPERQGRIRELGFGATKTNVALQAYHQMNNARLEGEVRTLRQEMDELRRVIVGQLKSTHEEQTKGQKDANEESPRTLRSEHASTNAVFENLENTHCKLIDWTRTREVVEEGTIASTDPESTVHHVPLGSDCWKVWVTLAVRENTPLYRPTSEFSVLGDAIGSTIAWPRKYIVLD